jgi:hypothetical protein
MALFLCAVFVVLLFFIAYLCHLYQCVVLYCDIYVSRVSLNGKGIALCFSESDFELMGE